MCLEKFMTLVICSGNCLQECELMHLDIKRCKRVGFIPHILHDTICRAAVSLWFMGSQTDFGPTVC